MKYGLIGGKLGHSYSKIIHEALMPDHVYELKELKSQELDSFMKIKEFAGINVTIPYKTTVMQYLDAIESHARKIGAVNVVVNREGKLYGYNTDYEGFIYQLDANKIDIAFKKVVVLGNGGASKAIQEALRTKQAGEIIIVLHNDEAYADLYQKHTDAQVIVNCTPVGMYPNVYENPVDLSKFNNLEACVDVVYNPLNTQFMLDARKRGIKAVGGMDMLVAQAKYALELFRNTRIPDKEIIKITNNLIRDKQNIVLIGMPGCGKSTIGEALANKLKRQLVDIDEEIVKKIEMTIADFFAKYGEERFRQIERDTVTEESLESGGVISCGGGVVKDERNIHELRRFGKIIYLQRDIDNILPTDSRPLSSNRNALMKLYKERKKLYEMYADEIVDNNGTIEETVGKIIEIL